MDNIIIDIIKLNAELVVKQAVEDVEDIMKVPQDKEAKE